MKILVFGGTGFLGLPLLNNLLAAGHDLRVYTRGNRNHLLPPGVKRVNADLSSLPAYRKVLRQQNFDVVVDLLSSTYSHAKAVIDAFDGFVERVVALSSFDVYRSFAGLLMCEQFDPVAGLIAEDSPLRTARDFLPDDREKLDVEQAYSANAEQLPVTLLRIPYIYGPEDPRQRFFQWVKRFEDQRPAVLLEPAHGNYRISHAYVENVAHALALAVHVPHKDDQPLRLYNVGELNTPTVGERLHALARAAGYKGKIIVVPKDRCPEHLVQPVDLRHDIVLNDSAIRRELGYREMVDADEAYRKTIEWQRTVCPLAIDLSRFDYAPEDALLRKLGLM